MQDCSLSKLITYHNPREEGEERGGGKNGMEEVEVGREKVEEGRGKIEA